MNHETILIAGAGPTGLTAAALLKRLGLSVRIVDKNSERSDKSKALAVHAGTLECLEAAFGKALVERLISAGRITRSASLHLDEEEPRVIDLSPIPSRYNFILVLAQSETERILEEHANALGVFVERKTELADVPSFGNRAEAVLRLPDGREEKRDFSYVVGADGAHSAVRHALGLSFEGGTYDGEFILGDVMLDWPWTYDSVRAFVGTRGVIGAFPLKGEREYRLILVVKGAAPAAAASEISVSEFVKVLDFLSHGRIRVEQAHWLSRFRVHHRMVDRMHCGRVFLAGDAAHIHSPAGGQGMNTGMQDALNLGFKIKAVSEGADSDLLAAYEAERLPIARNVLWATDFFSRMMLLQETPVSRFLRRHVIPTLAGNGWVQKRIMTAVSEVNIARREISRYKQL